MSGEYGRCLIVLAGIPRIGSAAIDSLRENFISVNKGWDFDILFHSQELNPKDMPAHDSEGQWISKYKSEDLIELYSSLGTIKGKLLREYDTSGLKWRGIVFFHRLIEALDHVSYSRECSTYTGVPSGFGNYDKALCIRFDAVILKPLLLDHSNVFVHFEERRNKRPCLHSDMDYAFMSDIKAVRDYLIRHYQRRGLWEEPQDDIMEGLDEAFRFRFESVTTFRKKWEDYYSGYHQYLINRGYSIRAHPSILDRYI
jgi:hypothetical protein